MGTDAAPTPEQVREGRTLLERAKSVALALVVGWKATTGLRADEGLLIVGERAVVAERLGLDPGTGQPDTVLLASFEMTERLAAAAPDPALARSVFAYAWRFRCPEHYARVLVLLPRCALTVGVQFDAPLRKGAHDVH